MKEYLQASEAIDWQHNAILELAREIRAEVKRKNETEHQTEAQTELAIAKATFEWVRDRIYHSSDYQMNPITWRASDVLQHKTGFCYAKSHLLAALLRANGIPTGFCYQRLSVDDRGAPYSLHGFNAAYLPAIGWYRFDARGNRPDVNAQFVPPKEQLAYQPKLPEEADFDNILPEPLPLVLQALQTHRTLEELYPQLPDVSLDRLEKYGLILK
ncbi:MAG: transglutaminase domain-containing protein [Oscillatoria sp. SIO1A7]|nr:transglutaminase domain-containing protein [Oscillatoria sp. SIO1A7]